MKDHLSGLDALVCIPTYNERDNIEQIVPEVLRWVPRAHVLVIDDGSPDGTGELADGLASRDFRVHVLHRERKEGLGRAYMAGFRWGLERGYRFIFEMDADFSHDPAYLPVFLEMLMDADVVVGSRRVEGGGVRNWGLHRRLISWAGSLFARSVLGVGIRDLTGGYNGFRREVLERIGVGSLMSVGYSFQIELKYRCLRNGLRVVECPIVFPDRVHGKSKMNVTMFAEAMVNVVKMRLAG